jgi:hypothetical protein
MGYARGFKQALMSPSTTHWNDREVKKRECKPSTTLGVTHGYGRIFAALDSRACRRVEGAPNAVSGRWVRSTIRSPWQRR